MRHSVGQQRCSHTHPFTAAAATSLLVVSLPQALAQTSSATLRGQVTADAAPAADAQVTATNTETGLVRTTQSGSGGSYVFDDAAIRLCAEVLNVFDHENVMTYDVFRANPGELNAAFGQATGYRQPTRTYKLSLSVDWR